MKNIRYFLKNYPLSCLTIAAIWVVCLLPVPETPLSDVSMIDKWTHLVMYGSLCLLLWGEYGRNHRGARAIKWKKALTGAFLLPIVMGCLVEVAQATLTNGMRSGDPWDALANALGVVAGAIIGIPLALCLAKCCRG